MAAELANSEITITLLPHGMVRLHSTLLGRFDSSYAPLKQESLPLELARLLAELRVSEAAQFSPAGNPAPFSRHLALHGLANPNEVSVKALERRGAAGGVFFSVI